MHMRKESQCLTSLNLSLFSSTEFEVAVKGPGSEASLNSSLFCSTEFEVAVEGPGSEASLNPPLFRSTEFEVAVEARAQELLSDGARFEAHLGILNYSDIAGTKFFFILESYPEHGNQINHSR